MLNQDAQLPSSEIPYEQICNLIESCPDSFWKQAVEHICDLHNVSVTEYTRIREGGNLLFKIADDLIIKLVPPHWAYQGQAEIDSVSCLDFENLSLAMPKIIASGECCGWVYVIMTYLDGRNLASVWSSLSFENKQSIIQQAGSFLKELHLQPCNKHSALFKHWPQYHRELLEDCLSRHTRKKLKPQLLSQISNFFDETHSSSYECFDDLPRSSEPVFIHMDIHPWNLMVKQSGARFELIGVLDFGDAVIGRSRLLELATPLLFMCQGNRDLCESLFSSYELYSLDDRRATQIQLMGVALLRPACDFNFVLQQVPETAERKNWYQVAEQLFPIT